MKLGPFILERVKFILDKEKTKYDEKVLVKLIMRHSPDLRRLLNEMQRYSVGGIIDVGILKEIGDINIDELSDAMKTKNFAAVKKWVVANLDNDQSQIFRKIYDGLQEKVVADSIPSLVLIISEYQYKAAFVADQEINMTACIVQLMMECNFK
jgi:replication factor C small subunit